MSELFSGSRAWTPLAKIMFSSMIVDLKAVQRIFVSSNIYYYLMSTLPTNVEVVKEYQPCRYTPVKPNINFYSTIKRQRFINYQQRS